MKENDFWGKVRVELKRRQCFYYKPVDRTTAGCPDILICAEGKFIGVELKVDNNDPTAIQMYNGVRIVEEGGSFFIMKWLNDKKCCRVTEVFGSKGDGRTTTEGCTIEQAFNLIGLNRAKNTNAPLGD